jgi:hypothetical protein
MIKPVRVIEDQRRRRGPTNDHADSVIRAIDFRFNVSGRSFVVKLTPGRYGLICFFLDPGSRMPHFAKGMSTEFDVE